MEKNNKKHPWEPSHVLHFLHKTTLMVGKYSLKIIYEVCLPNLGSCFRENQDIQMQEYINNNTDEAFYNSVFKYGEYQYYLNIASTRRDFYGDPGMEFRKRMVEMFVPIIRKFIKDAATDNLYITEDGELVKQ